MSEKPHLDSVFEAAVQIESAAERSAFLDKACGDDQELRNQVEQLLQSDKQVGSFLAKPISEADATFIGQAPGDFAASMEAATFGTDEAVVMGQTVIAF